MSFSTEEELCETVGKWLEERNLVVEKKLRIGGGMELDIVAVSNNDIFRQAEKEENVVYVVECKLAYTRRLIREAIEEAILRLTVADYVLIATPYRARVWVNSREQKEITVPTEIFKLLRGRYSRKLGLIAVDGTTVMIIKKPETSKLYIPYVKELIIKNILKKKGSSLLRYKTG